MPEQKTNRQQMLPQMSARHLADYMAASETARRTIVRDSKYQPIARVVQHDEARTIVAKFMRGGEADLGWLTGEAQRLRDRLADTDFDRDLFDHNADYIDRFATVWPKLDLPKAGSARPGSRFRSISTALR